MSMFDKVKNLFTEEIEDEKPVVKREVSYHREEVKEDVKPEVKEEVKEDIQKEEVKEEKKEEKFVFFDDSDFEDLEPVKKAPKKEESKLPYKGTLPNSIPVVEKKEFKPTPIISPIYGVLDKNYKKEQVSVKKTSRYRNSGSVTIDDVRNIAFSTIEDDLKNDLLGNDFEEEIINEDELNIFSEVEEVNPIEEFEEVVSTREVKNKDVLEVKEDETDELVQRLDEQKKKLDEITEMLRDKPVSVEEIEILEIEEEPVIEESFDDIDELEVEETTEQSNIDAAFADSLDDLEEAINETDEEELKDKELYDIIDSIYDEEGEK